MKATLREARLDDAAACGRICHDAFEAIARQHNFPKDLPSREVATEVSSMLICEPRERMDVAIPAAFRRRATRRP